MAAAVFAVTTRSGLRGVRFFPAMFLSSLRIRRQLARTPGCVRWASVVTGPREFWTITVWETRDNMFDFMRSGAHEDIMWLFGKWLESFWLMRWRPSGEELGAWNALSLARRDTTVLEPRAKTPQARTALGAALDALPALKQAAGEDGAASYENSPAARRHRKAVAGAGAVIIRLQAPYYRRALSARRDIRGLARELADDPALLRCSTGVGRMREHYLLAVLRDEAACSAFLARSEHAALRARWGEGYWAMRWEPANEFGHWDGMRLRKERTGSAIPVPEQAAQAARTPTKLVQRRR